jgi:CheY-like chemotaxis protein
MTGRAESPRVLIVDDDADNRELFAYVLRSAGLRVEVAANGREALEKSLTVLPHVIVTDLSLPELDGFQLCAELRRQLPTHQIPVIAVTGSAHHDLHGSARGAGITAVLVKPCSPDVLLSAVVRVLEDREPAR